MVKRYAMMIAAAALVSSSVGCCLTGCGYRGYGCPPCGGGYSGAASPCGPGGCQPSYYPQQGAYYQGYGMSQTAFAGDASMMTASPIIPGSVYPTTASAAPINTVPVY